MTREIDKAITKILFGNDIVFYNEGDLFLVAATKSNLNDALDHSCTFWGNIKKDEPESFCIKLIDYSVIENAWKLVEIMTKKTEFYISTYYNKPKWGAYYKHKGEWVGSIGDTAAKSICLAFLKFNEIELQN